jgi:PAS domain S-box-containing protein
VIVVQALPGGRALSGSRTSLDDFLALLPTEERQVMRDELAALERGDLDRSILCHRRDLPGGVVWLETTAQAVRNASGQVVSVRACTQNVTEHELDRRRVAQLPSVRARTQSVADDEADTRPSAHSLDLLQGTIDSLPLTVAVLDESADVLMTNRPWKDFGVANGVGSVGLGANYLEVCDAANAESAKTAAAGLRTIISREQADFTMEYPCHGLGVERWFSFHAARREGHGDPRIVVTHRDVTQRHQAEATVKLQATLIEEVDVAVVASDGEGRVTYWNRAAERLYGWTAAEALARHSGELIAPSDDARAAEIARELKQVGLSEEHFTASRKDGTTFPAHLRRSTVHDDIGLTDWTIDATIDITDRVRERRELLSTRNYLRAVTDSMGEGLFTLDAEGRVTYMNDATETMLGWSRHDLLGRIMHQITHNHRADGSQLPIADCPILRAYANGETVRIDDDVFSCRDGRRVPVAYTASPLVSEDTIQGCVVVFQDITARAAQQQALQLEADKLAVLDQIKRAVDEDLFVLYAQPIVDLQSGEAVQHELLLRMHDNAGGVVLPGTFLPVAEHYGIIGDIDRWVVSRAAQIAGMGCPIEINLSASSIGDLTMLDHIARSLREAGADPGLVVFEITETAIIADEASALRFAEGLHELGCGLALDDFGTGYGSFTYLKHLPVDYLKIDVEFVRDLVTSPPSRHVVDAVIALARSFGLRTVAEGVEDVETLNLLRVMGADFAQGYYTGRPAPQAEVYDKASGGERALAREQLLAAITTEDAGQKQTLSEPRQSTRQIEPVS